jgi:hypothetical protein
MARLNRPGFEIVYAAAQQFVDCALRRDDSMFTRGRPIWSLGVINDLYERFVLRPDESDDTFVNKFRRQLQGSPSETIQLAGELLYVHFLMPLDIGGRAKRKLIGDVLSWSPSKIGVPEDLAKNLDYGIARVGLAYKTYRPYQLWYLIELLRAWKSLEHDNQETILRDPWSFRALAYSVPIQSGYAQREAILHLVFPDVFEPMVSRGHKVQIVEAFAGLLEGSEQDVDHQLLQVRMRLQTQYGSDFSFYDSPIKEQWDVNAKPSDKIIFGTAISASTISEALDVEDLQSSPVAPQKVITNSVRETQAVYMAHGYDLIRQIKQILPALQEAESVLDIRDDDVQDKISLAALLRGLASVFAPPSVGDRIMAVYPTPIALAYRRFRDAEFNVFEQVSRLTDLFEAASVFVYHVVLSDALRRLDPKRYYVKNKGARLAFNGFSMATRIDFVAAILETATMNNGKDLFAPELLGTSFVTKAKMLQEKLRNVQAHTGTQMEGRQVRILKEFQPEVEKMLGDLGFLENYRLVRIPTFHFLHGQMVRQMEVYQSASPYRSEEPFAANRSLVPVEKEHLVLLNASNEALDLYPFYQLVTSQTTRDETHVCFFKQRKAGERRLEGESIQGAFEVELDGFDELEILLQKGLGEPEDGAA